MKIRLGTYDITTRERRAIGWYLENIDRHASRETVIAYLEGAINEAIEKAAEAYELRDGAK